MSATTKRAGLALCLSIAALSLPVFGQSSGEQSASAPPHDPSLVALNDRFNHSISLGDIPSMLELYAEDTLWLAPNAPRSQGLEGPEASYRFVAENGGELSHTLDQAFIAEDRSLAVMIGTYRFRAAEIGVSDDGSYLLVLRPDGASWKIAADMFNSDRPAAIDD